MATSGGTIYGRRHLNVRRPSPVDISPCSLLSPVALAATHLTTVFAVSSTCALVRLSGTTRVSALTGASRVMSRHPPLSHIAPPSAQQSPRGVLLQRAPAGRCRVWHKARIGRCGKTRTAEGGFVLSVIRLCRLKWRKKDPPGCISSLRWFGNPEAVLVGEG